MAAKKAEPCDMPGCEDEQFERGLCEGHWWTHRGRARPEVESDG